MESLPGCRCIRPVMAKQGPLHRARAQQTRQSVRCRKLRPVVDSKITNANHAETRVQTAVGTNGIKRSSRSAPVPLGSKPHCAGKHVGKAAEYRPLSSLHQIAHISGDK